MEGLLRRPSRPTRRAEELHEAAHDCEQYPVVAEVLRGYLNDSLDVPGLGQLLGRVESGEVGLVFQDVEFPLPFGHARAGPHRGAAEVGKNGTFGMPSRLTTKGAR